MLAWAPLGAAGVTCPTTYLLLTPTLLDSPPYVIAIQACAAMTALQMSSSPVSSGALLGTGAAAPDAGSGGLAAAGITPSKTRRQKGHRGVLSGVASHTCRHNDVWAQHACGKPGRRAPSLQSIALAAACEAREGCLCGGRLRRCVGIV